MFTGLVEACVPCLGLARASSGARLRLPVPDPGFDVALGDSVAVSGVCLTVAARLRPGGAGPDPGPGADLAFDLSPETLERTWLGAVEPGRALNLERALRVGDRLGGHLVQGHVDGLGELVAAEPLGGGHWRFEFEVAAGLERYLVDKGSVTLDGVSLTVVRPRGRRFEVAVVPHTFERTALRTVRPGQAVHVEADVVGKWVERLVRGDA